MRVLNVRMIFYVILLLFLLLALYNFNTKDIFVVSEDYSANTPIGSIYEGDELKQYIDVNDELKGFEIRFGTYNRYNNNYIGVSLYDESNEMVYKWEIYADSLKDGEYAIFLLPDSTQIDYSKKYYVSIVTDSKRTENCNVTIFSTLKEERISHSYLYDSGILKEGILDIKTINSIVPKEIVSAVGFTFVFVVILLAFMMGFCKKMALEKKFLVFSLVVGVIFAAIIPYGVGPDEKNHMKRIFEISEGYLLSDKTDEGKGGRDLPDGIAPFDVINSYSEVGTYYNRELDYSNEVEYEFGNTALYSPVSYLIQVISVSLAKMITNRIFIITIIAKLAVMIFVIFVVYNSIKMLPTKKELLVVIALLPMFIQQMVVISADGFTNSLSLFLISYVLYLKYTDNYFLTRKDIILLCSVILLISLSKIVYLPLVFLVLIIPKDRFKDLRVYRITIPTLVGTAILANICWLRISTSYLYETNEGVDSKTQAIWVLTHPFDYLNVIYNTVLKYFENVFWQFFGDGLGALSIPVSRVVYYAAFLMIILLMITQKKNDVYIKNGTKILLCIIFLICTMLILTSEYVQWTSYRADVIEGVQGRYFYPIILLLLVSLSSRKIILDERTNIEKYLFPVLGVIDSYAIISIMTALN